MKRFNEGLAQYADMRGEIAADCHDSNSLEDYMKLRHDETIYGVKFSLMQLHGKIKGKDSVDLVVLIKNGSGIEREEIKKMPLEDFFSCFKNIEFRLTHV